MNIECVVGFAFNSKRTDILLIKKNRPEWQAGLMNGIGGKVESGEEPMVSMVREFQEEAGIATDINKWLNIGVMYDSFKDIKVIIHVYAIELDDSIFDSCQSMTDEEIIKISIDQLFNTKFDKCISNLPTLINMSMLCLFENKKVNIVLTYNNV